MYCGVVPAHLFFCDQSPTKRCICGTQDGFSLHRFNLGKDCIGGFIVAKLCGGLGVSDGG